MKNNHIELATSCCEQDLLFSLCLKIIKRSQSGGNLKDTEVSRFWSWPIHPKPTECKPEPIFKQVQKLETPVYFKIQPQSLARSRNQPPTCKKKTQKKAYLTIIRDLSLLQATTRFTSKKSELTLSCRWQMWLIRKGLEDPGKKQHRRIKFAR